MDCPLPTPEVVWWENLTSSVYLEEPEDVDRCIEVFDRLRARALGPAEKRRRLETLIQGAVEVSIGRHARPSHELDGARWRKGSYSGGNDNCVEIADLQGYIAVRDAKCPGLAPALASPTAWSRFVSAVTEGTLN